MMGSQEDETVETLDEDGNIGSFDIVALQSISVYCYTSAHTYENDDGRQVHEPPKTSVFLYRPDNLGVMTN